MAQTLAQLIKGVNLASAPANSFTIDSSGRCGIGTATPSGAGGQVVEIYSSGSISELHLTNSTSGNIGSRGLTHILNGADAFAYNRENGAYIFGTNNTERFRCDSSGRLLVGTSSSSATTRFEVYGQSSSSTEQAIVRFGRGSNPSGAGDHLTTIQFAALTSGGVYSTIEAQCDGTPGTNDYPGRLVFSTTADGASSPTERMRIRADGQIVCVATYDNTTANAANVHIFTDKSLGRSTSSIKYKENVEDLQDIYADAILNCRPVWYQSKCTNDNPDWGYWGFIAEEVEQVDPRLCHYGADENGDQVVESVQYDRFVPHLLNLIKRQKEQIEAMEARLSALESA